MRNFDDYLHSICLGDQLTFFEHPKDDAGRLHELRLRIKRLKALTRLLRSFAPNAACGILRDMRKLAPDLSELRDRDVALNWIEKRRKNESFRRPSRRDEALFQRHALAQLPKLEKKIKLFLHSISPTKSELDRQFQKNWRKARKLRRHAKLTEIDTDFHHWRRKLKDLQYQIEALRSIGRIGRKCNVRQIKKVALLLGDAHDRVIVEEYLKKTSANASTMDLSELHDEKMSLVKRALEAGAKLHRRPGRVHLNRDRRLSID